ncbi:BQ2448_1610 [Microbotryum intermedium]|uniref:BQ2448_1610 protein n=1 Tax=Microbotryum intermedium TaxID=269621 RepID=A0A238FGP2_9BASI|nr:BQ2448_1610 [Microbotryum intermedium]
MNASDLETYEYQLSQIKLALAKDPTNKDYLTLKDELTSLIDLTKEYLASPPPSTSTFTQPNFQAGQECLAKYSGDNKYYPCRITTVGGSDENRVFSIIFHGYESTEIVPLKDLKPFPSSQTHAAGAHGNAGEGKKRSTEVQDPEAAEKERKRKKYEKKAETQATKTQEQGLKQKSWQQFAKKGAKKGVVIPGIQGASMFKSPEDLNPQARVGVVGSGRGMTKSIDKKKQSFA